MKKILLLCYVILLSAYSLPLLQILYHRYFPPKLTAQTVAVLTDEGETSLGMTEYLSGVVAAEMPASFEKKP